VWSTESLYLIFLGTGFTVGFGHCVGMCGPIVVSFSLHLGDRPVLAPHLLYNFGRTATYGIMGGIAGGMASFTRFASELAGLQQGVMILAGLVIAVLGLGMTGWLPVGRVFRSGPPLSGLFAPAVRRLRSSRGTLLFLPVGMILGLLPCGPVYTALIAAARKGMEASSALQGTLSGFLLMVCFGAGTIPALLLLSRISSVRWVKYRDWIYKVAGLVMVGMGAYFAWKGISY
jgi:sulfite exporter TauE/SafE